jgi:hypothetical protein
MNLNFLPKVALLDAGWNCSGYLSQRMLPQPGSVIQGENLRDIQGEDL